MLSIQETLVSRPLDDEFHDLACEWKRETSHLSRLDKIVVHPAYLKIIGMGRDALPFILGELQQHVDYWFPALEAITRTSVTPHEPPIDMAEAANAWIEWGRRHGYC